MSRNTLYYGSFVHSISLTELEYLVDALVYVADGTITWIEKDVESSLVQEMAGRHGLNLDDMGLEFVQLDEGDFVCPGLIDTHTVSPMLDVKRETWLMLSFRSTLRNIQTSVWARNTSSSTGCNN